MTAPKGRETKTKHCKKCGKPFENKGYYKRICPDCKTENMRSAVLNYNKNPNYLKWKWIQKKGNITLKLPCKAKWVEDAWEPYTTEKCATCNKEHFIKEKYDHPFTAFFVKTGINTEDLIELILEHCQETCGKAMDKRKIIGFLKRRDLIE